MCGKDLTTGNAVYDGLYITAASEPVTKCWCKQCQGRWPKLNIVVSNPVFANQDVYQEWIKDHRRVKRAMEQVMPQPVARNPGRYDYGATFRDEWNTINVESRYQRIFSKPLRQEMERRLSEA
jgi:hypothetical protein